MPTVAPRYAANDGLIDAARAAIGDALVEAYDKVGEVSLTVEREQIVPALVALRDTPGLEYQQLMEIAGVDYPANGAERFEVVYHLLSLTRNSRIRVRVRTDEAHPVPSVTGIWPVAGWLEREVFDMYGVLFDGNSDLRRILTDYGFRGHPQRKDFPLTGYVELRYSETDKRVVYEPVKLAQDYRTFEFQSPWEGASYTLPGDEKAALPQAKGAMTPVTADQIKRADTAEAKAEPPAGDKKVTDTPADTGAGKPHPGNTPSEKPVRDPSAPPAQATPAKEERSDPLPPEEHE